MHETPFPVKGAGDIRQQLLPVEHCAALARNVQRAVKAAAPEDTVTYAVATALVVATEALLAARRERLGGAA